MLLWDGDLIKCELSSTENNNCHNGQVQEIFLDEGELITAGADGSVKVRSVWRCYVLVVLLFEKYKFDPCFHTALTAV